MDYGNPPLIKPEDYLQKARDLLNGKPDGNIEEHISKTTGTTFKYNKETGELAIEKPNGEIISLNKLNIIYNMMRK